jgi:hypothetical protein
MVNEVLKWLELHPKAKYFNPTVALKEVERSGMVDSNL